MARTEWHANGVSWRVNHEGGLVATWWPNDGDYTVTRVFYGYTRREASRLVNGLREVTK